MSKDTRTKLSLFFGAGAEVSYGMPSGGRFAIDIFRLEWKKVNDSMREIRREIPLQSTYAKEWLPKNYQRKRIFNFTKQQHKVIIQSSLENRRKQILEFLLDFDSQHSVDPETWTAFKNILSLEVENFQDFRIQNLNTNKYITLSNKLIGENEQNINQFFRTKYFLLLFETLRMLQVSSKQQKLSKIVKSFIELSVGVCGIDLVQELNEEIFQENPEHSIFDEIGNIFSIDYSNIGVEGLEVLLDRKPISLDDNISYILKFAFTLLENLYEQVFDYQILMDIYFGYLYRPKSDWAKFCMITTFLKQVGEYIANKRNKCLNRDHKQGYYHDLKSVAEHFRISTIATTNYTQLISDYYPQSSKLVQYLNGKVDEIYDPYHNQISPQNEINNLQYFTVPLLFTQNVIKPLTTISISQRYVDSFNKFNESDIICAIGFGFNSDDGHINSLFRTLLEEPSQNGPRPKVVIMDFQGRKKNYYSKRLRLREASNDNLFILKIDQERQVNGEPWYEALAKLDRQL